MYLLTKKRNWHLTPNLFGDIIITTQYNLDQFGVVGQDFFGTVVNNDR